MARVVQNSVHWLLLAVLALLTAACAGTPSPAPPLTLPAADEVSSGPGSSAASTKGLIALEEARKMLGVGYRYGGADPRGFDCSGLVHYAYGRAGVSLPRTSREILRSSQLVDPRQRQPGDLVFFSISARKVSHVGIYDGGNRFIHAPSKGKAVGYARLDDDYWSRRLVAVGRLDNPGSPPDAILAAPPLTAESPQPTSGMPRTGP